MIFESAVPIYQAAGWTGTLPLPVGLKFPPPDNSTGNYPGVDPNTLENWLEECDPNSNIGLRMSNCGGGYETIGIDIDQYGVKTGWEAYRTIAEKIGTDLPPTYKSSARGADNPSGIHFYRVPAGRKWRGKFGADIETIQRTHRYAVVWPSQYHEHDEPYCWYETQVDGGEAIALDGPPNVDDIPELPEEWIDYLQVSDKTERVREPGSTDISMSDAGVWMKENFPGYDEKPSMTMARAIDSDVLQAEMETGAHDAMVSKIHAVVRYAAEGHHGLATALKEVYRAFTNEVLGVINEESSRRSITDAKAEWDRALAGEIGKLRQDIEDGYTAISPIGGYSAEDADTDIDGIRSIIKRLADRRSRSIDVDEYPDNHRGIAKMIRDFWGSDLRPIAQTNDWAFWDDAHNRLEQLNTSELYYLVELAVEIPLKRAAEDLYDTAEALARADQEDEAKKTKKEANELMRRSTNAGNVNTMESSLKVSHALPGERVYLRNFDTNVLTLGVKNGVLDLATWKKDGSAILREGSSKDLILNNTGVAYDETATHPLWDNYLDTFLPDLSYRKFVRKVMGYALMGGNPQRLMIFLHGPTSTGKTTIEKALLAATGDYTATVAPNALFRERQDAGPAPEVLAALPRRIVFSSEVSGRNHLHADVIKRLTGGDEIAARALYSNEVIVRRPMFTPVIATNSSPTIKDGDAALWRRVLVLPFDTQVPTTSIVNTQIEDVPEAASAVLAWLVEGWKDYLIEGLDQSEWPSVVRARHQDFIGYTSDFQRFLSNKTAVVAGEFADRDKLYQAYQAWCVAEMIKDVLPPSLFTRKMTENGIDNVRKSFRDKATKAVKKRTMFVGIKMTS